MSLSMKDMLPPERPKRERKVKEPKVAKEPKPKKKPRRWDASLRLYGPRGAPTHARLIIGADPPVDTPEAFYNELMEETHANQQAKHHGLWTYFKIGFRTLDYFRRTDGKV